MLKPCFSNVKNVDLAFPKEYFPLPLSLQAQMKSSLVMKTEFLVLYSQISLDTPMIRRCCLIGKGPDKPHGNLMLQVSPV